VNFRYGVKPEWLLVHRVLSHKHLRDGRMMYLVKWRDLPYSLATWEHEDAEYIDLKSYIDFYWVNFTFCFYLCMGYLQIIYFYVGITSIL